MTYYPDWFDDVSWVAIICGVVCFFAMKGLSAGRKRGFVKLAACLLMAIGFGFGGTAGVLFNSRAPHLTVEGVVSNVALHYGKGSSTKFTLTAAQGPLYGLHISSAKSQIAAGENAQVTYQAGSMVVLNLHIVDGPNAGFDYSESDGDFGAVLAILGAFIFAIYGVVDFVNDGTAVPAPSASDNRPSPPGDADTKSMLNL